MSTRTQVQKPAYAPRFSMQDACRFFPSVVYLATSKIAVATLGNLAFALALLVYHAVVKVTPVPHTGSA